MRCGKRCVSLKRDVCMWKEMYDCVKRRVNVKRGARKRKEICEREKGCVYVERDV